MKQRTILWIFLALVAGAPLAARADWYTFQGDGSFSVQMPMTPELQTQTQKYASGDTTSHIWVAHPTYGAYLAGRTDYPMDLNTAGELKADRDNFLKEVKGTLTADRDLTVQGYPCKEFTGTSDINTYRSRVCVVNPRLVYMVVAGEPTNTFDAARADRFLQSLQFNVR